MLSLLILDYMWVGHREGTSRGQPPIPFWNLCKMKDMKSLTLSSIIVRHLAASVFMLLLFINREFYKRNKIWQSTHIIIQTKAPGQKRRLSRDKMIFLRKIQSPSMMWYHTRALVFPDVENLGT